MSSISSLSKKYSHLDQLDFSVILAHCLHRPKEFIYSHPEYSLTFFEALKLKRALFLYRRGYPIAYITLHKEFFGLDFYVNRSVLIPRPETEMLVEEATKKISNIKNQISKIVLIDIGTGSGCIPITIATTIRKSGLSEYPDRIYAIDISRSALRVAKKNAKIHGVKIQFLHGNLLQPIINKRVKNNQPQPTSLREGNNNLTMKQFNNPTLIITANLPYLTLTQFKNSPSIQKEPRSALVADNNNGLSLYEQLFSQIQSQLRLLFANCLSAEALAKAGSLLIFFEIDPSQSATLTALSHRYLPTAKIEIKKDLCNQNRLIIIKLKFYG